MGGVGYLSNLQSFFALPDPRLCLSDGAEAHFPFEEFIKFTRLKELK